VKAKVKGANGKQKIESNRIERKGEGGKGKGLNGHSILVELLAVCVRVRLWKQTNVNCQCPESVKRKM